MTARGGHNRGRVSSLKPRTVMSSIMRARSGLTDRWEGSEVIRGSFLEPKVAGPSMLGIGHPEPSRATAPHLVDNVLTVTRNPSRASGFVLRRILVIAGCSGEGPFTSDLPTFVIVRCRPTVC